MIFTENLQQHSCISVILSIAGAMNICSPLWLIPMLYNDFPTMYGCIWLYCIWWWWWWCVCVFVCVCVCSPAVENSPQSKHNLVVDPQENIPIYPGTLRPATLLFAKG